VVAAAAARSTNSAPLEREVVARARQVLTEAEQNQGRESISGLLDQQRNSLSGRDAQTAEVEIVQVVITMFNDLDIRMMFNELDIPIPEFELDTSALESEAPLDHVNYQLQRILLHHAHCLSECHQALEKYKNQTAVELTRAREKINGYIEKVQKVVKKINGVLGATDSLEWRGEIKEAFNSLESRNGALDASSKRVEELLGMAEEQLVAERPADESDPSSSSPELSTLPDDQIEKEIIKDLKVVEAKLNEYDSQGNRVDTAEVRALDRELSSLLPPIIEKRQANKAILSEELITRIKTAIARVDAIGAELDRLSEKKTTGTDYAKKRRQLVVKDRLKHLKEAETALVEIFEGGLKEKDAETDLDRELIKEKALKVLGIVLTTNMGEQPESGDGDAFPQYENAAVTSIIARAYARDFVPKKWKRRTATDLVKLLPGQVDRFRTFVVAESAADEQVKKQLTKILKLANTIKQEHDVRAAQKNLLGMHEAIQSAMGG